MRCLMVGLVLFATVSVAAQTTAGTSTRTRTSLDHSAFFNAAGYQEDIPVRVGPGSTTIVTAPRAGHRAPFYWVAPVRSYWVPGYYQWTTQRVWVEPTVTREYVPPVYQYHWVNGTYVPVMVRQGYYRQVVIPGHYEERPVQVWVNGYWAYY
jgi:hypothetical protein